LGEVLADAVARAGGQGQEGEGRKTEGGPTGEQKLRRRGETFRVYARKRGLKRNIEENKRYLIYLSNNYS
jgi:hypothetical protein